MSRHHGYLQFVAEPLSRSLTSAFAFSRQWCSTVTAQNSAMYAAHSPPQVGAAFVLQHLLSIPAQACAFAAVTGPWRVEVGTLEDTSLSVDLAPRGYPVRIGLEVVAPADADLDRRIDGARTAYGELATQIAQRYDVGVKMSSHQRFGMVDDLWQMALREARAAVGQGLGPPVERASCCFIYALPGCHECAGCPRLSPPEA
jgi:hypothetical protein